MTKASRITKSALVAAGALAVAGSAAVAMAAMQNGRGCGWGPAVLGGVVAILCVTPVLLYVRLKGALDVAVESLRANTRTETSQAAALTAIHGFLGPGFFLPSHRRWAASPDLLAYLCGAVLRVSPRVILEAGCGASTLVLAGSIRRLGLDCTLISLEEDKAHADATIRALAAFGLGATARIVYAPLIDHAVGGKTVRWYDSSALASLDCIDLLLVDGPSGVRTADPLIRYAALPLLRDKLSANAILVLDDARREAEQSVLRRWRAEFPEFEIEFIEHEKGTAVLTRASAGGPR